MTKFDIWAEPYLASGMEGIPSQPCLIAEGVEASSFEEACDIMGKVIDTKKYGHYNPTTRSVWGCKLHPSKEEAEAPWAEIRNRLRTL